MSSVLAGSPGRLLSDWVPDALAGVGVAIIAVDAQGRLIDMNAMAETLTGWPRAEAAGRPAADVFRIEDEPTRRPAADPVARVIATGSAALLHDSTVLIARDGTERRVDHGAAPVREASGAVVGAVLVFCDVGGRVREMRAAADARLFAEEVVHSVREPLVILDADMRVRAANRSYYRTFRADPAGTVGHLLFDLDGRQWDVPRLRELLEQVLPRDSRFDDFEAEYTFPEVGRRTVVLNARQIAPAGGRPGLILLAFEDATERYQAARAVALSEVRYRRLFETAQDGILLVDPATGLVFDANPFVAALVGCSPDELVGKELWEIGLFRDIESSKAAFETLRASGYIRYDDLPLRTRDGRGIEVEFVSNVYLVGDAPVIQCNIRDVTDRKRAEDALLAAHAGLEDRVLERTAELARANASLVDQIARRQRAEAERRELQRRLATAQEDERRRIARELHDQMGQHLAALGLGLQAAEAGIPDPSPVRDRLQALRTLTDRIGREVHQLALDLRPTALDDLGLHEALANYVEGWAERSGVEVDFHTEGLADGRLPAEIETAVYRVVQEALTNVLKHAMAGRVSVVLQRSGDRLTGIVEDDGLGFVPESPPASGHRLGVLGMRERMALVGGTLSVESSPGGGTTVIARAPLPGRGARDD